MYDDLVNENLNNKNIKVFSTSDNVVEIMENEGEIEKGIFCSAPIGPFQEAQSPAIVVNQTGAVAYIHNSYQQYGILFKVIGDVYVTATYPPNLKVYVALDNCHWKARCGEDVTGYSHSWMSTEKAQFGTFVTLHRVLLYNGAKRLERYDIRLRGRIEDYDQSSPGQTYTTYFTEWVRVTTY